MLGCRLPALLCLCLAALHTAAAAPWFCHGTECPQYKVINTTALYETRFYPSRHWAAVKLDGYSYDGALREGFAKLFKYIGGANEAGAKIPMTSPVAMRVEASTGPFCKSSFYVFFYVPNALQDAPPTPTDPEVFIDTTPDATLFVSQYGGWASGSKAAKKASELTAALALEGVTVQSDHYYTAGYDPPFRLLNRHNEVWLEAVDDCTEAAKAAGLPSHGPAVAEASTLKSLRLAPYDVGMAA